MKNAGLTIGMVAIGIGLASIGFNLNGNQAVATPATYNAGPEESTIVWYDVVLRYGGETGTLFRAWSDGTVEGRELDKLTGCSDSPTSCGQWVVISTPTEGLNAAADINFDEIVDGADMGLLLGNWGKAPRSPIPASNCPLGLMQ